MRGKSRTIPCNCGGKDNRKKILNCQRLNRLEGGTNLPARNVLERHDLPGKGKGSLLRLLFSPAVIVIIDGFGIDCRDAGFCLALQLCQ